MDSPCRFEVEKNCWEFLLSLPVLILTDFHLCTPDIPVSRNSVLFFPIHNSSDCFVFPVALLYHPLSDLFQIVLDILTPEYVRLTCQNKKKHTNFKINLKNSCVSWIYLNTRLTGMKQWNKLTFTFYWMFQIPLSPCKHAAFLALSI